MSDDPSNVAFNPAAPPDERRAAAAEIQRSHMPTASALIPADDVRRLWAEIQDMNAEADMLKARGRTNVVDFPGTNRTRTGKRGMQSVFIDNMQIYAQGEYFEKPSVMGFDSLRYMVQQTPVLNAVIMTRIRQVGRFCEPSEDGGMGFMIRHIDHKHKMSKDEQAQATELARFVQNCGWEFNPRARRRLRRDNFRAFMSRSVRDTLTMDACPIETEWKRDRKQGLDGFYSVDGTTVRLCTEEGYEGDDEIFAVQVIQGRIATTYTYDQLIYEVRNPQSDVRVAGYGIGETELLIRVVTGFLNALSYNIAGFDQNAIPRGLLHLSGNYSADDLASFKRYWNGMVKGINNAWSLPVMVSPDQESKAVFEKFGADYDEMMFAKFMTLLVSIICSIYGMAPDEINFESFAASKSSLSGSDTSEKLANSKDQGLRPLLAFYESMISDFIISEFNDKLCFRWVGLEEEDQAKAWEAEKLTATVNEIRTGQGREPLPDAILGDAPVNPALLGLYQQMAMPQPGQGDFGGGGEAPEEQGDYGEFQPDDEEGAPGTPEPPDAPQQASQAAKPAAASGSNFGGGEGGDFGKAHTIYSIGD